MKRLTLLSSKKSIATFTQDVEIFVSVMNNPFRILLICAVLQGFAFARSELVAADLEDWTLEDVLKKIEEANGGSEAIEAVTSARFLGEVKASGSSYDFVLLKKRPGKMRIHLLFINKSVENGINGKTDKPYYLDC